LKASHVTASPQKRKIALAVTKKAQAAVRSYDSQLSRAQMSNFFDKLIEDTHTHKAHKRVSSPLQTLQATARHIVPVRTILNDNSTNSTTSGPDEDPASFEAWLDAQPTFDDEAWIANQESFNIENWIASKHVATYHPDKGGFSNERWISCQSSFDIEAWIANSNTIQYKQGDCGAPVRLVACANDCCRVEIQHEGEWGTICDDVDDAKLSAVGNVICKKAGCKGGTGVYEFGGGADTQKIWLDDLACTGEELAVEDCAHAGWNEHNCGHSEDMGVCCADGCTGA